MKSQFLTPLSLSQVGAKQYELKAPLRYGSSMLNTIIEVPPGFMTDGESAPRWLPIINSLFGDCCDEPAVIHDWLYYTAMYSRQISDKVLFEACGLIKGIGSFRRNGIYYGLRIGGWVAWNEHRRRGHSLAEWNRRHQK